MKKTLSTLLVLCSFSVIAQTSAGVEPIITDRPDQTESPVAVDVGVIQVETGLLFERSEISKNVSVDRTVYPTNLFRIGLLNRLELRIVNEVVSYKTTDNITKERIEKISGTENMQVGFKYQLIDGSKKTIVGVMAHAIVPTGSRGISNKRYGVLARLNVSFDISDNKNFSANFGYINSDYAVIDGVLEPQADGNFVYTLVYGVGLGDRVGIYLEAFGEYVEFQDWSSNMDAGMTFLLKKNIQLDYSYGWGLNSVMNYHSIGISFRLPK